MAHAAAPPASRAARRRAALPLAVWLLCALRRLDHGECATVVIDAATGGASAALAALKAAAAADNGGTALLASSLTADATAASADSYLLAVPPGQTYTVAATPGGCDGNPYCTLDAATLLRHVQLGAGATLTLSNVRLVNGTPQALGGAGGAVWGDAGATLAASGCVFEANAADGACGGAVQLGAGGVASLSNCTFSNNVAGTGGALCLLAGAGGLVSLEGVTFSGNIVDSATAARGGAVYAGAGVQLNVTGSSFSGNYATMRWGSTAAEGGAIYLEGGASLTDAGSLFAANAGDGQAGAICVGADPGTHATALTLRGSTFRGNMVGGGSGGAVVTGSGVAVTAANCTFVSNQAPRFGGALALGGLAYPYPSVQVVPTAAASFAGCTFQGNSGGNGGALAAAGVSLLLADSVFDSNSATTSGGGVWTFAYAPVAAARCAFSGNSAGAPAVTPAAFAGALTNGGGAVAVATSYPQLLAPTLASFSACVFDRNSALHAGLGGALLAGPQTQLTLDGGTSFADNEAAGAGGGAVAAYLNAALSVAGGVIFARNAATGGSGGALLLGASVSASVANAVFSANYASPSLSAGGGGGAVALSPTPSPVTDTDAAAGGASLTLADATLSGNFAVGDAGGGALFVGAACAATLGAGVVLAGNSAPLGGGAFVAENAALTLAPGTSLTDNKATAAHGGAVFAAPNATVSARGARLADNAATAGSGGAVAALAALVTLDATELSANGAFAAGGAVYAAGGALLSSAAGATLTAMQTLAVAARLLPDGTTPSGLLAVYSLAHVGAAATLTLSGCALAGNSAVGETPRGGALALEWAAAAALANCTLSGNWVSVAAQLTPMLGVTAQVQPFGAGTGGAVFVASGAGVPDGAASLNATDCTLANNNASAAGGALSAPGGFAAGAVSVALRRCALAANAAPTGGCAALGGGVTTRIYDSAFLACAATGGDGGALALSGGGSTTGASNVTFTGCVASRGAVAALADAHALQLAGCVAAGNAAGEGGGFAFAAPSAEATLATALRFAPPLATTLTNNSAPAGALFYATGGGGSAPAWPPCAPPACAAAGNAASNYGPFAATAPTSFNVSAPATTRTGAPLPLSATLYDAYGTAVATWPGLSARVVADSFTVPPATLSGSLFAAYGDAGAAAFAPLALAGLVNRTATLRVTVSAPDLAWTANSVATQTLTIDIEPCANGTEIFDATSRLCACLPGTARAGGNASAMCAPCAAGTFAPAGAAACSLCPANAVSAGGAAACTACPANAVAVAGACVCTSGRYSATGGPPVRDDDCVACPEGVACAGGVLLTAAGFWRASAADTVAYACREGLCLSEEPPPPLPPPPLSGNNASSPLAVATTGASCLAGHTGPVCAVCSPGHAYTEQTCQPCAPGDAWAEWSEGSRAAFAVLFALFALAAWLLLFWLPMLPPLEARVHRAGDALAAAASGLVARVKSAACCRCGAPAPPAAPPPVSRSKRIASTRLSTRILRAVVSDGVARQQSVPRLRRASSRLLPPGARSSSGALDASTLFAEEPTEQPEKASADQDAHLPPHAHDQHAAPAGSTTAVAAAAGAVAAAALMHELAPEGEVDAATEAERVLEALSELLSAALKPLKIVVNFFQIVTSFKDTLDVPWPRVYFAIMSRVGVINMNFIRLPAAACLHPELSYYSVFNGYTLGTAALVALALATAAAGVPAQAALARYVGVEEAAQRRARFNAACMSRLIVLLYLVYPGVSGMAISAFSCDDINGTRYLQADYRRVCSSALHRRYMAAAAWWLVVYPIGIPLTFLALLLWYEVPQLAAAKVRNARLAAAAAHAWRLRVAQPIAPDFDVAALTEESITDAHLDALHAAFCADVDDEEPQSKDGSRGTTGRLRAMLARLLPARQAAVLGTAAGEVDAAAAARAAKLAALQRWCASSGEVAIPLLCWAAEEGGGPEASSDAREAVALRMVGFLFAQYHCQAWYWELVELGRRLLLTALLALVVPGSATQVSVGCVIAFAALQLLTRAKPYAEAGVNAVATLAQVNLLCYLFVGLLLKVRVDGRSTDSRLFNAVVGVMSVLPVALPALIRALAVLRHDEELLEAAEVEE